MASRAANDLPLPDTTRRAPRRCLPRRDYGGGLTLEAIYPNFTTYGVSFTTM